MSESDQTSVGAITWFDLTVEHAEQIRDFYQAVVGWRPEPVRMGDYSDFNMCSPGTGSPRAGVCHARGGNADLPPQWLLYINVGDLDASMAHCESLGGKVLAGPKSLGGSMRFCVIQDPAGAVAALCESWSEGRSRETEG